MITDIAWSPNPAHTVAVFCGIDGNILIADFEGELGRPMPPAALERHFQSLYGRNIQEIQQRPQALIESTLALKYTQQVPQAQQAVPTGNRTMSTTSVPPMSRPPLAPSQAPINVIQQQTIQVIGGKKRIRPVLMANNLDSPDEVTSASLGPAVTSTATLSAAPAVAAPVLSSAHSSQSFGADSAYSNDFDDSMENSALSKRMRQHSEAAAPSRIAPSAGVAALARQAQPAGSNGQMSPRAVSTVAPVGATVVERYMSIRFENDEVICSVPLLGSQQRIQRFVKTPLPGVGTTHHKSSNASSGHASAGLGAAFVVDPSVYHRNEPSPVSSAPPTLIITAARLTKPAVLAQLRHSGGSLSSITLSANDSSTAARYEVERSSAGLWTAVVAGEVTCLAAAEASRTTKTTIANATNGHVGHSSYDGASAEGLALVGCSDGTVHCLGLGCGMRFTAPMVLGAAVSYLDLQYTPSSTHEKDSGGVYTALAVTADGEIWKWSVDPLTAQFRCTVRTNLRPALLSMKCRHGANNSSNGDSTRMASTSKGSTSTTTAGKSSNSSGENGNKRTAPVSIRVESCLLSETGAIQVHLLSQPQSSGGTSMSGGAGSAEGGDWQAFAYNADAMVWTRLADMRYVLSSMFSVKTIGAGATSSPTFSSDHISALSTVDGATCLTSLSTLQSLAASGAKFSTKDIMSIAAAKQAVKFGLNHGPASSSSIDSTGAGTLQALTEAVSSSSAESNKNLAPNAEDWANLVTIGHVEDRLSVALSVGHAQEIDTWVTAWVTTCCKNGLTGRLQWFARKLIAQHIYNLTASTASTNGTTPSSTPAANSRMSCADWLVHLKDPLEILKTVVLPVIAQNPKVHSLLADINQSLELLNLG
eukprot:gene19322-21971_t